MARQVKHLTQYARFSFFLLLAQVQALEIIQWHGYGYKHERSPASYRSSWRWPTPLTEELEVNLRRIDVESSAIFGEPRQTRSHHGTAHHLVPVRFTKRSRQQVEALLSFKAGVSGGDMTAFSDWNANDSTPCGWTGVSCSPNKRHVTELNLPSQQLKGNISSALFFLGKLQSLQALNLSSNNFTSFISGPALVNFSRLALLDLSYNQVSGHIPDQIGELSNLQSLVFVENSLSGAIPGSIGNCTRLRTLNLESNLLVSEIPSEIGRLTQLEEIYLGTFTPYVAIELLEARNQIFGSIPPSLGNCSSLLLLNLDNNPKLGGQIPSNFNQLQRLQILRIVGCNFIGILPRWMGNLSSLAVIGLGRNQFNGPIPAKLGRLPSLFWLDLDYNFFSGEIPPEIANCTSLIALGVAFNRITGIIPAGLRNCTSLRYLFLGSNLLMARQPIPPWITSLTQLDYIYLADMNLYGTIPSDVGILSKLQYLRLDSNFLHGTIPSSLANCTGLQTLIVNFNSLTGHIPPEIGLLTNLLIFQVEFNILTGLIPTSLTNLTQLVNLVLRGNSLSGTIEGQWGQLSQLQFFDFQQNRFVGSIPKTLSNCSNIIKIDVSHNQLTGGIPASFGNLSRLVNLFISHNSIGGSVPADLARCSSLSYLDMQANKLEGHFPGPRGLPTLTKLYLNDNDFSGTITESVMNLTELIELDLSGNKFSGSVPGESDFTMKWLTAINLSHNFLSGSLPTDWRNLEGILIIDVSANMISGSIPTLRKLKGLQVLDVSRNKFSGNLPQSLASLPSLRFFNASYNKFVGPVPFSESFSSNITAASFLGNPGLCGSILGPSRECPGNASLSDWNCKQFQCARVWIPTTGAGMICFLAAAAAMVVWRMRRRSTKQNTEQNARQKYGFDTFVEFSLKPLKLAAIDVQAVIRGGGNVIGSGAQSVVYKASFPGCDVVVALKTFVDHHNEGTRSRFRSGTPDVWQSLLVKEASVQAKLRHRNVVEVMCYCSNPDFMALLLEYMPQGSLENHLYPSEPRHGHGQGQGQQASGTLQRCELPWSVRFGIAVNVAEAMTYVHHECPEPLIHGDLKPSNILLDDDMMGKVADFGISKLINLKQEDLGEATVSKMCGTVGYMPPEYAFVTTVSTKGDVFSYGVILLEMLSGRSPRNVPSDAEYRNWNLERFQQDPTEMLDPVLQEEGTANTLKTKQMGLLAKVAFLATRESPQSRPSMKDVRAMLLQIEALGVEAVTTMQTIDELLVPMNCCGTEVIENGP